MIASLPMYDRPDTMAANDRFWAVIRDGLRARGIAAPDALCRDETRLYDQWLSPDLVLSQTCGLPYRADLHGKVTLVGTPDYGVEGAPPGYYRSRIVVRVDDARARLADYEGARLACNSGRSQSGWASIANHWPGALGCRYLPTGAHVDSVIAVASGQADLAAIDAVTWELLVRSEPAATALRVLESTEPTPGLPLIAAVGRDRMPLFDTVAQAITALAPEDRAALCLRGLAWISPQAYLAVPTPPRPVQNG